MILFLLEKGFEGGEKLFTPLCILCLRALNISLRALNVKSPVEKNIFG